MLRWRCPHHIVHPDPEALAAAKQTRGWGYTWGQAQHDCDGCCNQPAELFADYDVRGVEVEFSS